MSAVAPAPCVGRFAPSPTGPLHFGSLVAALGSFLAVRASGGCWRVRIDNLDRQREVPGVADQILRTLAAFGLEWDGPVVYQSDRIDAYAAALQQLRLANWVFDCSCSRGEVGEATLNRKHPEEVRYPGTCRAGPRNPDRPLATRFRVPSGTVNFRDLVQGDVTLDVSRRVGDFVIRRRDGFFAYQLAVVMDDQDAGTTEIVRGADLLESTPRQILLQQALGLPVPRYAHLPLAVDAQGNKLSKSSQSMAVDASHPATALWLALDFLHQSPPAWLRTANVSEILGWGMAHWSFIPLEGVRSRLAPLPMAT